MTELAARGSAARGQTEQVLVQVSAEPEASWSRQARRDLVLLLLAQRLAQRRAQPRRRRL